MSASFDRVAAFSFEGAGLAKESGWAKALGWWLARTRSQRWGLVLAVALVIGLAAGLGGRSGSGGDSGSAGVPWGDYAPQVQGRIDRLEASGDCVGLQDEFDTADANNDATLARTGHNNADLMRYIDAALTDAGCYD